MSDAPASTPITTEKSGQTLIVRPRVKMLDDKECKELGRLIDKSADADAGVSVVVLDLSGVGGLPSLGLSALLQISSKCKSRGQKLKLAAVPLPLRQVLSITRLDRVFDLTATVQAAVE